MDIIYADELFFLNALTDYLLLLIAARLRAAPLRRIRFALAAAVGGIYALLCALPPLAWLGGGLAAGAVSLLLALIAYGARSSLLRGWLAFLALSAAFAGAVYALGRLSGAGSSFFPGSAPFRVLFLSFGIVYAAVRLLFRPLWEKQTRRLVSVTLSLGGRSAELTALLDTGNELREPLSGTGVLIADAHSLAPLFPPETAALLTELDATALFRALARREEFARRISLIPYSAVGTAGLLSAFRPDTVTVDGEERTLLVAVSPTPLGRGEYTAIL